MENKNQEKSNEFGEFGEIAVRNCFICGKTIKQDKCWGFCREKDKEQYGQIAKPPTHFICLKCLLKAVYTICPDRKELNDYMDLFIKAHLGDNL